MTKQIILNHRDRRLFQFLDKYRLAGTRSIFSACGFSSLNYANIRMKKLIDYGYIQKYCLYYGHGFFYSLTRKGLREIGISKKAYKPSYATALHYIGVADIAAEIGYRYSLNVIKDMYADKDFYHNETLVQEYGIKEHKPDILFKHEGKTYFIEYERSRKRKKRILQNMLLNSLSSDKQIWVIDTIPFEDIKKANEYKEVEFMDYEDIITKLKQRGGVKIGICK